MPGLLNITKKVFGLCIMSNLDSFKLEQLSHFLISLHGIMVECKTLNIQQNLVGCDPVGSEPHWEAILNFQKIILDKRFYTIFKWFYMNFLVNLHDFINDLKWSLKWIFDMFMKVRILMTQFMPELQSITYHLTL